MRLTSDWRGLGISDAFNLCYLNCSYQSLVQYKKNQIIMGGLLKLNYYGWPIKVVSKLKELS
jgi:hypothetical protein